MNDYSPTFLSADNRHSVPGIRQVIDLEASDPQPPSPRWLLSWARATLQSSIRTSKPC